MIGVKFARLQFVFGKLSELWPDYSSLKIKEVRANLPSVDKNLQAQREKFGKTLHVLLTLSQQDGKAVGIALPWDTIYKLSWNTQSPSPVSHPDLLHTEQHDGAAATLGRPQLQQPHLAVHVLLDNGHSTYFA